MLNKKQTLIISVAILAVAAIVIAAIFLYQKRSGVTNQSVVGRVLCFSTSPDPILMTGSSPNINGNFFADSHCRTLYVSKLDKPDESLCYDVCRQTWIPYIKTEAEHNDLPAINNLPEDTVSKQAKTLTRRDGSQQYSINGRPLYYYSGDRKAGDTNGQNLEKGNWTVAQ